MGVDVIMSDYGDFEFNTSSPTYPQDYQNTMKWIEARNVGYRTYGEYARACNQRERIGLERYAALYDGLAAEPVGPVPAAPTLPSRVAQPA